jgi:hypothetical protein
MKEKSKRGRKPIDPQEKRVAVVVTAKKKHAEMVRKGMLQLVAYYETNGHLPVFLRYA